MKILCHSVQHLSVYALRCSTEPLTIFKKQTLPQSVYEIVNTSVQ